MYQIFQLNNYEKLGTIGKGSFGEVFKVREKQTNNIYAAKISIIELDTNAKLFIQGVKREVNIFSKMNNPSILKFIGYSPVDFNQESYPTIITEYAPNGSLGNIINLSRCGLAPDNWDSTKKLLNIYGIATGMAYLHLHNIIHRDLKPDNILMDQYLLPKIADFGLSKKFHQNEQSESIQSTACIKGTPKYIAPEIWKSEIYDKPGDVYSFSLIVYEILTNDEPFKNFNQFQILSEIVYKKNRPILCDSIPDAYKKLIESCWKDDPNERPTFDQIVEELRNNEGFITDDVEKEDFLEYIDYIDHYESTFNSLQTNYFPGSRRKSHAFQQVSINQIKMKINEVEDKIKEENDNELKEENDNESKEDNNNELKDKKIIKSEDEKPTIIKSFFNLFAKHNDQIVIKYPVDEFNKLDKKCQQLIIEANEDRDVQFIVGRSLVRGENEFPLNIEMGIKYLEKSISNECIDSVLYYSKMLIKGDIIPKDVDNAKKYLQKFFKENNGRIFHLYAKIVYNEKNFSEAKKYFEKSAKLGNAKSMYRIAKMLFKGEGAKMNKIEALKYFERHLYSF